MKRGSGRAASQIRRQISEGRRGESEKVVDLADTDLSETTVRSEDASGKDSSE